MRAWLFVILAPLAAACTFAPDYSGYPQCEAGQCPSGYRCHAEANICLSECGNEPPESCANGGLILLDTTLPPAIEGEPYTHRFGADGGTPPYTFTAAPVPAGLTFDGGVLAGTAGDAGTNLFLVEVTDSAQDHDEAEVSLTVAKRLRLASGGVADGGVAPLSDADFNELYSEQLSVTGAQNVSWSLDGGSLPSGLALSPTGEISGTPTSSGTFTVVATTPGPPAQSRARTFSIDLSSVGLTLHIRTRSLPLGRVGEPYLYKLTSGGGTGTHSWEVIGSLPGGLSLNLNNELAGTPVSPGDYSVTVKVTDTTLGTAQRLLLLRVDP